MHPLAPVGNTVPCEVAKIVNTWKFNKSCINFNVQCIIQFLLQDFCKEGCHLFFIVNVCCDSLQCKTREGYLCLENAKLFNKITSKKGWTTVMKVYTNAVSRSRKFEFKEVFFSDWLNHFWCKLSTCNICFNRNEN